MCVFMGCDYFLSDDKTVVRHMGKMIRNQTQTPVEVLDRKMCIDKIKDSEIISRDERRALGHVRT